MAEHIHLVFRRTDGELFPVDVDANGTISPGAARSQPPLPGLPRYESSRIIGFSSDGDQLDISWRFVTEFPGLAVGLVPIVEGAIPSATSGLKALRLDKRFELPK
ncbi:hypothetical protein GCM10022286_00780 [Gryllotalpicola daejeonensis]|uniref:Uncharacterized protein n=1 Tax=Gryllotalpicola daejeonensis TaxID=993087 RepID=A0ABP7ZCV3_9MICO